MPNINESDGNDDEHPRLSSAFAILALRLHLDLDFAHPSRASRLVSSKMSGIFEISPKIYCYYVLLLLSNI